MMPSGTRIARVMPNTPSQVSCGATVFCTNDKVRPDDIELISKLFSSVGMSTICMYFHKNVVNCLLNIVICMFRV